MVKATKPKRGALLTTLIDHDIPEMFRCFAKNVIMHSVHRRFDFGGYHEDKAEFL